MQSYESQHLKFYAGKCLLLTLNRFVFLSFPSSPKISFFIFPVNIIQRSIGSFSSQYFIDLNNGSTYMVIVMEVQNFAERSGMSNCIYSHVRGQSRIR